MGVTVEYVDAPLGHRLHGVDLAAPLDDATFAEVEAQFNRHGVVVIPGQRLTPEQQIGFSRRLGALEHYHVGTFLLPGHPEIFVVSNVVEDGRAVGMADAGQTWHSDMCFTPRPPRCSLLYALEVPHAEDGRPVGETLFASTAAAHDALPQDVRQRIAGLKVVNSYASYAASKRAANGQGGERDKHRSEIPDIAHPLVRTHPVTGRKCLYASQGLSVRLEGIGQAEGDALLAFLLDHMTKPEFTYRHEWRVGDLVIWDNCSAIHRAVANYGPAQRRRMHRTTVTGTTPA